MSKQSTEQTTPPRQANTGRIPDVEWLFGYGETKNAKKSGFLQKLLRRDWGKLLYSTLIYLLQASPVWILPLITSDVIDLITIRPDGYLLRICIDAAILFVLVAQNVPTTTWRSSIVDKWMRCTTAEIKGGVIRKLQRLSITYHKEIEEGRIQSKFLRDIETVEAYYRCVLQSLIPSLVGAVISTAIAIWKSPIVALFFLAIIPAKVITTRALRKHIRKNNSVYRATNEDLSSKLTTTLQMLTLTKAHGLISTEEIAVTEKIEAVKDAGIKVDKIHFRVRQRCGISRAKGNRTLGARTHDLYRCAPTFYHS